MLSKIAALPLFPLLISSLPAACAAPAEPSSCGSLHPKWTLSAIDLSSYYTYTSPSASGPKLGSISFTFANSDVSYTAACKGNSVNPLGTFYSSQTFDCETEDGATWKKTSFSYDTASKIVVVNSTWTCNGGDVLYSTSGEGKAELECETDTWTNPEWEAGSGELYSNTTTTCEEGSLVIQI
ncbi:hypothetical protein EJ04DRAFT_510097 [Polyplosphaeria fusca]|uniref:AA1-like domain-containing protein n=1 Tax=Polyplosphaeria fusca TaxID=682080 RepID=A0A9P4V5P2_9PLEO|nr:hypothetical protein EJ04DRAFT_510097 [Polyplosphaeria fusca]